jgi:predicted hydrocarbon binding protein
MNMKIEASKKQVAIMLDGYKSNIHIEGESGELHFGDLPIILARAEIMSNIYQELEKLVGESASAVMKRLGKSYGEKFYDLISRDQAGLLNDRNELYRYVCAETQAIGWGKIAVEEEGKIITIFSRDGLVSGRNYHAKGKVPHSADPYFLGYFEGFLSKLDRAEYLGEEVECVAKGDKQCKMVFTKQTSD